MNFRVALISGYTNDPEFSKSLLLTLNDQSFKYFDFYLFASPTTSYYLEDNFFENLNYECQHIKLKENKGFTGNNNYAIETAFKNKDYKYVVLVNDDTQSEVDWLKELIEKAEATDKIGAVASKMVFYEKFVTLTGETESEYIGDERRLGIRFYENSKFNSSYYGKRFYTSGFYVPEEDEIYNFRWTSSQFTIEIPLNKVKGDVYKLNLFLKKNPHVADQILKLSIGNNVIANLKLEKHKIFYEIDIPASIVENNWHYIIQNAGSGLTENYSGYDIGFGQIDKGQYEKNCEVEMFCGGSCLLSKQALMDVGIFTDGLFSYYEDSDLSMRIKKAGYKIVYNPKSVIRHYHTGTNKEWSPFFTYYAFRNKIIFAAKNFGVKAFTSSFKERLKETYFFFKIYARSRFKNKYYKSRLKLNIIILKDAVGGIIKFKPKRLT